ncbi:MAG: molybdate ABC transporter substrate-binding protein [Armatimonadetes bacterium]|nr:molybdate ABC transporter substrate-binding protein [Armatimonadota bacterium]MDW8121381.1 molybdate ABC transporter substrate-binding protein [Armatimonadota bacterium]
MPLGKGIKGLVVGLSLLLATIAGAQKKQSLHLFVPCGMIVPFTRIKSDYEQRTGVKLDITFDNGVMLVRRIRDKGERPDILVAPGELEIQEMIRSGFIDPKSVVTFGTFRLILVVPGRNRARIQSLDDLTNPRVRSIVIADPKLNSVGYYAREALKGLGLWEKIKDRVVTHWHAQEAVNYICMGRVDAGIYYASCPFDSAPEKVMSPTYRILETLPLSSHPPVRVQAGILKSSRKKDLAKRFLDYLLEPRTQATLAKLGIPNYRQTNGQRVSLNPKP